jgi:hypothetical protein
MGYCPYYSKDCPESTECYLWDSSSGQCYVFRQIVLLEEILVELGG